MKGWRTDYSDLAAATGFTRSYTRRVLLGEEKMTEFFMLRYIKVAGADPANPREWASLFTPILHEADPQEAFNYPKLKGQMPYNALSLSADFRRKDNPDVEEKPFC